MRPLKLHDRNWRSRWLYGVPHRIRDEAMVLHRVAEMHWNQTWGGEDFVRDRSLIEGYGRTVCGLRGRLSMPGIFSRMARRRCVVCCKALGLPLGYGAPFNDKRLPYQKQVA